MNTQLLQIAVPLIVLIGIALFFGALARQAVLADTERHRKAKRLTQTARDAVLGSVGWHHTDGLSSEFDCGMVSREVGGRVIVARQARLTQDTIASL